MDVRLVQHGDLVFLNGICHVTVPGFRTKPPASGWRCCPSHVLQGGASNVSLSACQVPYGCNRTG